MPKLFVAADLPSDAAAALVRLQPSPDQGVRLPTADQFHLTLHFLGEADLERVAGALASVRAARFSVKLDGIGRFDSPDGAITLWAGVAMNDGLRGLHGSVAAALSPLGFRPEGRPYSPHITLARCNPGSEVGFVSEFLAKNSAWSMDSIRITAFGLYSTTFVANAPVYRLERTFRLSTA